VIYYHTAFYREFATLNLSGCIEYALLTNIILSYCFLQRICNFKLVRLHRICSFD